MIEIRPALPDDLDWLCKLEEESFSLPWTREQLEGQMSGENKLLLVAQLDGRPAGYMGLYWVLDEGYVTNVCTSAEYRRRGVASALINSVTERARELDLSFITLEVRASNASAHSVYAQMDFNDVGVRPGYYEKPAEDAVIMTLYLKEVER